VVLASAGYPDKYPVGLEIRGLDVAGAMPGVSVFHAGTAWTDGRIVTSGGRVLGVTAAVRGQSLASAIDLAYAAAGKIAFDGMHFRRDIGRKGLAF
jgi:phosphoribosylamine--glycine ligase